jgi:hypothetical protein
MEECGITIAHSPAEIGKTLLNKLSNWKILFKYYTNIINVFFKKFRYKENFIS